jgi:hypothetical protein
MLFLLLWSWSNWRQITCSTIRACGSPCIFKLFFLLSSFSSLLSYSLNIIIYTWFSYLTASSGLLRTFTFITVVLLPSSMHHLLFLILGELRMGRFWYDYYPVHNSENLCAGVGFSVNWKKQCFFSNFNMNLWISYNWISPCFLERLCWRKD